MSASPEAKGERDRIRQTARFNVLSFFPLNEMIGCLEVLHCLNKVILKVNLQKTMIGISLSLIFLIFYNIKQNQIP